MIVPRPDVEELAGRLRSEISFRALGGAPVLPMSIEDVLSYVVAGSVFETYGAVEQFYRELDPATASCDGLYAWSRSRGLFPTGATSSRGFIQVTGVPGVSIPLTTTWSSPDDFIYNVDPLAGALALSLSGTASVPVRSTASGSAANLASGATVSMTQTTAGLNVQATVTQGGVSGGSDAEDCEEFRARVLSFRKRGILSTNVDWLLSQVYRWPGLTRACVVDCSSCFDDSSYDIAVFFDGVYPNGVPPFSVISDMNAWMFGPIPGSGRGLGPIGLSGQFITSTPTLLSIDLACTRICPVDAAEVLKKQIAARLKELICSGGTLCKGDIDFVVKSYLGRGCLASTSYAYDSKHVQDNGADLIYECGYFPVLDKLTFVGSP